MQASASRLTLFVSYAKNTRRQMIAGVKCAASSMTSIKPNLTTLAVSGTALILLAAPMQALSQDEEDWWFDVEVIAFKRNTSNTVLEEDFSYITHQLSFTKAVDLISLPLYRRVNPFRDLQGMLYECSPNSAIYQTYLPLINTTNSIYVNAVDEKNSRLNESNSNEEIGKYKTFSAILNTEERFSILFNPDNCSALKQEIASSFMRANNISMVPVYLQQPAIGITQSAHLLDDGKLALIDYAKKLFSQRDISALSHIAWRQPVFFGEDNASFYRIFAGEKLKLPKQAPLTYESLKQKYDPELKNIIDQNSETFFAELKQQLSEDKPVNWENRASVKANESTSTNSIDDVWELDGKVKVYLKYINRVPYLHIETEFEFHELQLNSFGEAEIEQYPFKQRRRVISKQIHYFDHPKMGIVIQLQRYEKPKEEDNENIY